MRNVTSIVCLCAGIVLFPGSARGVWDVYQANMPDVEKADHGHSGLPTCWLAAAANQLGAAGWNLGNAGGIYTAFTNANWYGTNNGGWCAVAASAYLVKQLHKQGPPPANQYTNINVHNSAGLNPPGPKANDWAATGATGSDYGRLLTELTRSNYVNVGLRPDLATGGHCVTLVGGDYYNQDGSARGQSVLHDNEGDLVDPAGNDDAYNNVGSPTWTSYNSEWECYYASVLTTWSIPLGDGRNYLGSYYGTQTTSGQYVQEWAVREAGYNYAAPSWSPTQEAVRIFEGGGGTAPHEVYLFIDYAGEVAADPAIQVLDAAGSPGTLVSATWSEGRDYACYRFHFDTDSPYREVLFPDGDYRNLDGGVINWHFTDVPEPAALSLLTLGGLVAIRHRRKQSGHSV